MKLINLQSYPWKFQSFVSYLNLITFTGLMLLGIYYKGSCYQENKSFLKVSLVLTKERFCISDRMNLSSKKCSYSAISIYYHPFSLTLAREPSLPVAHQWEGTWIHATSNQGSNVYIKHPAPFYKSLLYHVVLCSCLPLLLYHALIIAKRIIILAARKNASIHCPVLLHERAKA